MTVAKGGASDHCRREREVVVLHQTMGSLESTSLHTASANFWLRAIVVPVLARTAALHGPCGIKAIILHWRSRSRSLLLFVREPDPADVIRLFARWYTHVVVAIDGFAIGAAASVGYPNPEQRASLARAP